MLNRSIVNRRARANWHVRILSVAFAGFGALAVSACGDGLSGSVSLSAGPIQGGSNDNTHTFAVGIISKMTGGYGICSGALLAPNLVATARHCVADVGTAAITCSKTKFGTVRAANTFTVTTDSDLNTGKTQIAVSKIVIPSGSNQTFVCGNDLALLILSKNVTLPSYVTPVLSPPMTNHSLYSTTFTAVGYGVTSPADSTGDTAGIRRIKQGIKLACIPNDKSFTDCFPSYSSEMTAAEFMTGNGTCEGDSGSDAYEQDNFNAGRWVGFGVLSRGGSSSTTCLGGVYTRFDAWSSLIIDTAKEAATLGGYTVPEWAGTGSVSDGGAGAFDAGSSAEAGSKAEAGSSTAEDAGVASRDGGSGGTTARDAGATGGATGTGTQDAGASSSKDAGASATGGAGGKDEPGKGSVDAGASKGAGISQDAGTMPPHMVGQANAIVGGLDCSVAGDDLTPPWTQAIAVIGLALVTTRRRRR